MSYASMLLVYNTPEHTLKYNKIEIKKLVHFTMETYIVSTK